MKLHRYNIDTVRDVSPLRKQCKETNSIRLVLHSDRFTQCKNGTLTSPGNALYPDQYLALHLPAHRPMHYVTAATTRTLISTIAWCALREEGYISKVRNTLGHTVWYLERAKHQTIPSAQWYNCSMDDMAGVGLVADDFLTSSLDGVHLLSDRWPQLSEFSRIVLNWILCSSAEEWWTRRRELPRSSEVTPFTNILQSLLYLWPSGLRRATSMTTYA